jgi:transposase
VNRKARRRKTDRLDAVKLVVMLIRACVGEPQVWAEVRVPSEADVGARHRSRERTQLVQERTRLVNQMRSWVTTWGCAWPARRRDQWWTRLRDWAERALPVPVQRRLSRADARLQLVATQLAELDAQQHQHVLTAPADTAPHRLRQLKGVAATTVSVLLEEGLVWRQFRNRREVGGFLGYAPVPYRSGEETRDLGIDRAGNRRLRAVSLQLAWNWVRWQPSSALTQWYVERFSGGGRRTRLIGIVALARKLLIALWRYATSGVRPEGAVLKTG